jgi:hypothetical protein
MSVEAAEPSAAALTQETVMGLMPGAGANPFTPVDRQTVLGTFKSTGARDADVLYAQKETLIAPYRNLKRLSMLCIVIGGLFTITIFMSWFGIPLLLFAWWLWRFQAKNTTAVEDGYADYLKSVSA